MTEFFKTRRLQPYGGEEGRQYFSFYLQHIILPALKTYFTNLQHLPKERLTPEIFTEIIRTLGQIRQNIAQENNSEDSYAFGAEPRPGHLLRGLFLKTLTYVIKMAPLSPVRSVMSWTEP